MGQVVSLAQHQATKQMQIKAAEQKAQAALLQASAAYKELHPFNRVGLIVVRPSRVRQTPN